MRPVLHDNRSPAAHLRSKWDRRIASRAPGMRRRRCGASGAWALLFLFVAAGVHAASRPDLSALLERADAIKLRDPGQFDAIIGQVGLHQQELSERDRQYFHFLRAWKGAYDGADTQAFIELSVLAASSARV